MLYKLAWFNSYNDRKISVNKIVYKKEPTIRRSKLKRLLSFYSRNNEYKKSLRNLRVKRLAGVGAALAAAGGAYALYKHNQHR